MERLAILRIRKLSFCIERDWGMEIREWEMQNTLLKLTHFHEHSIKEKDLMTVVNNYTN